MSFRLWVVRRATRIGVGDVVSMPLRAQVEHSQLPPKGYMVSVRVATPRMKRARSVYLQMARRSQNGCSLKPSHTQLATATGPILSTKRFHP